MAFYKVMENVCSCFKASDQMMLRISRLLFPRTTFVCPESTFALRSGLSSVKRKYFPALCLISHLSNCCSRWSYDSMQDLRDFRSVGHEKSRSACLQSCNKRSIGFVILLPRTSMRVHVCGSVWLVSKKDWVAQLCLEEFVHADVNSIKGYTWETQSALYFLCSLSTGLISYRTAGAKVQVFMWWPFQCQGRTKSLWASASYLVLPTGELQLRWF